jgi:superfamily II DNA/RNA helicase
MPNFSKPSSTGGKKPYKSAGAPKGAQREGHRGFRADAAAAAPKKRWTQDDRAARTGDRPTGAARPAREDRRPDWSPRDSKPAQRPAYGDRTERPAYGDRKPARPSYGDRPERTERPAYNDRPARPAYNDRAERPAYNDRAARAERPAYNREDRPARPAYNREDRAPRAERPAYGTDRPARSYDRPDRAERPAYNREDRPARPAYNREDRAPRSFDRDDRPAKRESDYYTARTTSGPVEDVVLERLEAAVITASDVEGVSFGDLGLGNNIVRQLASMGAEAPFAIQAATIPDVLAGKDVLGRGKTGSGKTIAFGAPLVERLMENNGGKDRQMGRKPRALILAPTRELAQQIDRTVQPIARSVGLFTTTIVGGVPQYKQVSALQRGVDIVIATPGRVEDLVEQGRLDLSNVFVTVLDEADHMCDLGFLEPVQRILKETKEGGQKLLFSATLDKGVATLVNEFLVDPAVHEVAGEDQASSTIDHRVLLIEQRDKRAIIEQLASGDGKTLIFTRTRAFAEEMSDYLEDAGIPATSLHGDLNQSRRTRNLQLLTSGRVNVLVATDVAARGIHVDDISLVIQADAPEEYKTYLHRSGRTGRAGKVGTVVTLINRNRRRKMDELLGRAEIDATSDYAAPGDALLAELAAL